MPSLLDEAAPRWNFRERHEINVRAPIDRVYAAVRSVTTREIFLFRTLTAIRRFGRPGRESILNAPKDAAILDVALRTGFHLIAEDAPRDVVIGMWVIKDRAFAAMNFQLIEMNGAVRLTTETRVTTKDAGARRRFGWYWFAIRLGSGFIRRMWLRAIRRRAETP